MRPSDFWRLCMRHDWEGMPDQHNGASDARMERAQIAYRELSAIADKDASGACRALLQGFEDALLEPRGFYRVPSNPANPIRIQDNQPRLFSV